MNLMFEYNGESYYLVSFPGADECEVACPSCGCDNLLMAVSPKLAMILVNHEGETHSCVNLTDNDIKDNNFLPLKVHDSFDFQTLASLVQNSLSQKHNRTQ